MLKLLIAMKISATNKHKVKSIWLAAKADESQNENMKSRIQELAGLLFPMMAPLAL